MRPIFLLSPASASGRRAARLTAPGATDALAERVRGGGAPVGEVFAFLSGLYFRGKLAYARAQADARDVFVITATRGLMPAERLIGLAELEEFAGVDIATGDARFAEPLARDCAALAAASGARLVALLGSIATGKYVDVLSAHFGARLVFPREFVGRGDMSRGGLLLRAVAEGRTLALVPVAGTARHGARPPKLPRARKRASLA